MKRSLIFLFLFSLICLGSPEAKAQDPGQVQGRIIDSSSSLGIADVTITILLARDSSLAKFTRTNASGNFQISKLPQGDYRLLVTHIGYRNYSWPFRITAGNPTLLMAPIQLTRQAEMLDGVTVSQEIAPVITRNDTIEYNAGSFKTRPNAMVEDLLKKLPGLQVGKDGTIKANGETVKKILVDGKEFFGTDPKTASRNLPADAIDKVQVFDKKSDQSQFTGFDDGNSEKSINLSLKPDKKNGLFGRATAGAGTDHRYTGNFNVNNFSGKRQLSAIGMANNTNKQGFSFQDILGFSGGMPGMGGGSVQVESGSQAVPMEGENNPGIQTTSAGGINYNDFLTPKTEIGSNYFYSRIREELEQESHQQWSRPDGFSYITDRNTITQKNNLSHRINLFSEYALDSMNSIRYSGTANYQESENRIGSAYSSVAVNGTPMNDGQAMTKSAGSGFSVSNNLLLKHKFPKKGRTISATITANFNPATIHGQQSSDNNYYSNDGTLAARSSIRQTFSLENNSTGYGASAIYTEPLSKKALLEFSYRRMDNTYAIQKETYDYDSLTGKYSTINPLLSNSNHSRYSVNRAGMSIRFIQQKMQFTAGTAFQSAVLGGDSSKDHRFIHVLPNALLQYSINRFRNLRLTYTTRINAPDFSLIQPIIDNSDALNLKIGNPGLKPEYQHSVRLNYMAFDPYRQTNLFAGLSGISTQKKIVYADFIDSAGRRLNMPVNAQSAFSLNAHLNAGFPIKKLHSMISLTSSAGYATIPGYLNLQSNSQTTIQVEQMASWTYLYKEIIDLTADLGISYSNNRYSLSSNSNNRYWKYAYNLAANIYIKKGLSLSNEIGYTKRSGLSSGYNINPVTWNIGVAKKLFKNKKGEIKLQVFDLLKQNAGIERNAYTNYLEDRRYTVIRRYAMISFTYSINRFAGKSIQLENPTRAPRVISTHL